jgi:hypothetical protein
MDRSFSTRLKSSRLPFGDACSRALWGAFCFADSAKYHNAVLQNEAGWLEVTIRIGLAHPLILLCAPRVPIVVAFSDTGNTVFIDPPDRLPVTDYQKSLGAFDRMTFRVRRECADDEGRAASLTEFQTWHILSDAARTFWLFFETVRESDFRENNTLAGYPVAHADEIQNNALVRTCDLEWSYDASPLRTIPLSSHPAIQITENGWREAARRVSACESALPQVSFALDAAQFAQSDPLRAIIMACAAWETALRSYLAKHVTARQLRNANLPKLYEFMKRARGGDLFFDAYGKGSDAYFDRQRQRVAQLSKLRNKILHEGRAAIPEDAALESVLTILNAIEWLFA